MRQPFGQVLEVSQETALQLIDRAARIRIAADRALLTFTSRLDNPAYPVEELPVDPVRNVMALHAAAQRLEEIAHTNIHKS